MRTTKVDSGAQVNNVGSTRIGASVYVGRFGTLQARDPTTLPLCLETVLCSETVTVSGRSPVAFLSLAACSLSPAECLPSACLQLLS